MLDQAVVGIDSVSAPGECVAIDNTAHPVNKRLNLASALRNVIATGRGCMASAGWGGCTAA